MKRLLVCGGRDFADINSLAQWMREAVFRLQVDEPAHMVDIAKKAGVPVLDKRS